MSENSTKRKCVALMTEQLHLLQKAQRLQWYHSMPALKKLLLLRKQRLYRKKKLLLAQAKGLTLKRKYKLMTDEQRLRKTKQDALRRSERLQKLKMLLLSQGLDGWGVCSRCLKKKPLTAFGKKANWESNKLCLVCRIKILLSSRPKALAFSPEFFRQKAYSANKTSQVHQHKLGNVVGISTQPYVVYGLDIAELYQNQNGKCYYCGVELPLSFQIDHKQPLSRSGINQKLNLALTCADCNRLKSNRTLTLFKSFLVLFSERVLCRKLNKESTDN